MKKEYKLLEQLTNKEEKVIVRSLNKIFKFVWTDYITKDTKYFFGDDEIAMVDFIHTNCGKRLTYSFTERNSQNDFDAFAERYNDFFNKMSFQCDTNPQIDYIVIPKKWFKNIKRNKNEVLL